MDFFVLIAAALLIGALLAVSGTFSSGGVPYHTYFKSAGGLVSGAMVRYGGMEAGKVDGVRVDPKDSTRIEIDFHVRPNIPVKTEQMARNPVGDAVKIPLEEANNFDAGTYDRISNSLEFQPTIPFPQPMTGC